MNDWRLILDPAADAAWNMAVDETLLDVYAGETAPRAGPTLRLYGWSPPAVSLGSRQPLPPALHPAKLRERGLDLVRRPTGGRAVLHEGEWTYAVAGRIGSEPFPGGVVDTYRRIAEALVAALLRIGLSAEARGGGKDPGPFDPRSCFEVTGAHEIVVGSEKVIGSAQARRRRGFVQHGSIPMLAHGGRPDRPREGRPVLSEAAGREIEPGEIVDAIRLAFAERFRARLVPGELTREEALRAAALRTWKYDSAAWTLLGRVGARERRWGPELAFVRDLPRPR